jgi:hypothetical protein
VFAEVWAPLVGVDTHGCKHWIFGLLSQLQATNGIPPCRGFETEARQQTRDWLGRYGKKSWGDFAPTERVGIAQFGSKVASIIEDVLKRYIKALRRKLREDGPLQRLVDDDQLALIFRYLHEFHFRYEQSFGYTEEHINALGDFTPDNILRIRSTGFGAKLIAGLMMADRVQAARSRQYKERERVGFLQVEVEKIPKDCKDCPVCKEEMGVMNLDATQESCIQLVICCGQYFGEECLKTWLSAARNGGRAKGSCPHCRYIFPQAFMDKLLGPEQESEEDPSSDDFEPAPSIDPEYQQITNLLTPSPAPQIQLDPTQESQVELATTTMTATIADGDHLEIDLGPMSEDDFLMEG